MDIYYLLNRQELHNGQLYNYQEEGAHALVDRGSLVLADAPGLGKTVTVAAALSGLESEGRLLVGEGPAVLWITQANLVRQTLDELQRFLPSLPLGTTLDMTKKERRSRQLVESYDADILIVTYDSTRKKDAFKALRPTVVVLDEVAAVKSGPEGKTWAHIREITHRGEPIVWALTGTGIVENNPLEAWSILSVIYAKHLPTWEEWRTDWVEWEPPYQLQSGTVVPARPIGLKPGPSNNFGYFVEEYVLSRTAEEVGLDMPQLMTTQVWVPLNEAEQRKLDAVQQIPGQYGHHKRNEATRIGTKYGTSPLARPAVEHIVGRFKDDKVVVYAENLAVLDDVCDLLDAHGIGWVKITGADSQQKRAEAIKAHKDDSGIRVLLGTEVLERGLNLQHARVLMTLSPSDNPASEEQRARRIQRIGSPHTIVYHVVFLTDSDHERRRVGRLERKNALRNELLGV